MSAPAVTAVMYDRTNSAPVTDGDLVVEATGEAVSHWALTDASAVRRVNDAGDGSAEVPLGHPHLDAIDYRRVCRLYEDGEVIKSFVVNRIDDVDIGKPGDRRRRFSGDGMLSRLGEMLRTGPTDITSALQADKRRYDWGAVELDVSGWSTSTIYVQPRDDLIAGSVRPVAWPTPIQGEALGVPWLHWRPPYTVHPSETGYWHKTFTLALASEVIIFTTASDEMEVCVDGVELLAEKLQGPNSVWWYTWKCGALLPAGTHTVRIKVTVVNPTGAGGFISAGFKTGPAGLGDLLFYTGTSSDPGDLDGGWRVHVGSAPGMTPGQIMRIGQQEAALRDCETPTRSFDDDEDSNGDPWDVVVGFVHPAPTTELAVLDALAPWCEYRIRDDSYTLDMFNGAGGASSSAELEEGVNIVYLARHGVA